MMKQPMHHSAHDDTPYQQTDSFFKNNASLLGYFQYLMKV